MNASVVRYSFLFVLLLCLCSWGEKAHRKINVSCVNFFPAEISKLKSWGPILGDHASDPDLRKKNDKAEFYRHFIDLDNYEDFVNTQKIEENFVVACQNYGKANAIKNGTLPWTTDSTYRTLVQDFKSGNWDQAVLTAANLGHYIADGFMPLHLTANYDGQLSNQTGIHRRYEETMIDKYIDQISFKPSTVKKVTNVKSYIFRYLYNNYSSIGWLLQADLKACEPDGKQYNDIYYETLWGKSKLNTIQLLQYSSKTLAELIYTAWIEAGKPQLPG